VATGASTRTLSPDAVVAAALSLADAEGMREVTLTRVARALGCHVTSLYTHVDSLADLHLRMVAVVQDEVADRLWAAALGRSRDDALREIARVYREYGAAHPVRIRLLMSSPAPGEPSARRLAEPIRAALRSYGLADDQARHAHRVFSSAVRGFLVAESHGFFLGGDADATFAELVDLVVLGLESGRWPTPAGAAAGAAGSAS
jgi:AcrR family transcriptional regulator